MGFLKYHGLEVMQSKKKAEDLFIRAADAGNA